MPLIRSASDEARSENIAEMVKAGHPRDQAAAASYEMQRKMRGRRSGKKSKRVHRRKSRRGGRK